MIKFQSCIILKVIGNSLLASGSNDHSAQARRQFHLLSICPLPQTPTTWTRPRTLSAVQYSETVQIPSHVGRQSPPQYCSEQRGLPHAIAQRIGNSGPHSETGSQFMHAHGQFFILLPDFQIFESEMNFCLFTHSHSLYLPCFPLASSRFPPCSSEPAGRHTTFARSSRQCLFSSKSSHELRECRRHLSFLNTMRQ